MTPNKIIVSLLFFVLSVFGMCAQTFEKIYGGGNFNAGNAVEEISTGGYIIGGRFDIYPYVFKTDIYGNVEWEYTFTEEGSGYIYALEELPDGSFIATGDSNGKLILIRINENGQLLWNQSTFFENYSYGIDTEFFFTNKVAVLIKEFNTPGLTTETPLIKLINESGEVLNNIFYGQENIGFDVLGFTANSEDSYTVCGKKHFTDNYFKTVSKISSTSEIIWEYTHDGLSHVYDVNITSSGNYICLGTKWNEFVSVNKFILFELSETGELLWEIESGIAEIVVSSPDLFINNNNGSISFISRGLNDKINLHHHDATGDSLWVKEIGNNQIINLGAIRSTNDGGFITTNTIPALPYTPINNHLIAVTKTDSLGNLIQGYIQGEVVFDENSDCITDTEEGMIPNKIIAATNENSYFYGVADENGNYEIKVDRGSYTLQYYEPNQYWEECQNEINTGFIEENDTLSIDFHSYIETYCPALEVDITTPFLRRCFDTNYTVNYCNQGTIPAEDAYIEITFDQYLTPNSSTLPWTSIAEQTYTFELGDVAVQECGSFQINVSVGCEADGVELGQTHCVKAHIYPDSLCNPVDPLWDGSNIIVDAECEEDSVRFFIRNTGEGNMESPQDYIIIEDHIIFLQEPYEIPSGEEIEIAVPTAGVAYRMEAAQNPGHPIDNMPSINVTGCNVDEIPDFLLDFWNVYPDDDISPFISIDCQQNIGSFDPNDKQAFPIGYGEEHFIEANTEIEYLIRFQNTGTDTAFTVVVEDVLSEYLDITSIRTGASSHPYDFDIENGRKLKFTFNNILLPDSTTNEVDSHGFIKFKVNQLADNQTGTWIGNNAAIFFDFNAPVITNTVFHEIGEDFIESIISSTLDVSEEEKRVFISPNPFSNETFFRIKGVYNSSVKFTLHDTQGRLVREETYNENSFTFLRKGLSDGLYFYRIEEDGVLIDAGKIVVN